MIRSLVYCIVFATGNVSFASLAEEHTNHEVRANHAHASHRQSSSAPPDLDQREALETPVYLSRTPKIDTALESGGEPVVVKVLGVVCEFCAKAMNRTFGRREEIAAVHVDLDSKTLNLVLKWKGAMDDAEIDRLVARSGYKTRSIHRGSVVLEGRHAPDPA